MRLRHPAQTFSCLALLATAAFAAPVQPGGRNPPSHADTREHTRRPDQKAPTRPRSFLDGFPGARLFRPLPEDYRPLDEQEQRSIEEFIRQHAPGLYRQLRKLQRENPERFKQRLDESAPRLRALRRVFQRDPVLGRAILRYAENRQKLARARQIWRQAAIAPDTLRRLRGAIRRLMADNLRIERDVLNDHLAQLQTHRKERVQHELDRLADPDTDLAAESPEIRELAAELRAARNDEERAALRAQLTPLVEHSIDTEIKRIYRRVTRMREHAGEEVDRRVKRFIGRLDKSRSRDHRAPAGRSKVGRGKRQHRPGAGHPGGDRRPAHPRKRRRP